MRGVLGTLLSVLVVVACGGDGGGTADSAPPDAFETICGEPGDLGNSVGIGKFCQSLADCTDTPDAPLCANLGDPLAHFCTRTCAPDADAGPPACGEGATCTCGEGGCGCTPDVCL